MVLLTPQAGPLPVEPHGSLSESFWEGAAAGELRFVRCTECGQPDFPSAGHCRFCLSYAIEWEVSSGQGTLYSYTIVWRPVTPAFTTPYVPAIVDLDEGYSMMTNLIGVDTDDLVMDRVIDMRVVVQFEAWPVASRSRTSGRSARQAPVTAESELPLSHLRVLEIATDIAGPYAGKLFADAGADVVKVEAPSGDPMRRYTAGGPLDDGDSALFAFLNTSKRSVVGATDDDHVLALAGAADVVIVDGGVSAATVDVLRSVQPAGVVIAITPFGLTGPSAGEPATEFTLQARCGSTGGRGLAERIPLAAGGRLGEWIGGAYGAVAGLAYARRAREHGIGELVDVSLLEAMLITMGGLGVVAAQIMGVAQGRSLELPSIEPTADGYVGFCTITGQQFQDFLVLIEHPEWLGDADLASFAGRQRRRAEFDAAVREWTTQRTTAEIIELASAMRIPVAPIGSPDTIAAIDHFVERGVFVPNPAGFVQPRPPYRLHGGGRREFTAAPAIGAHTGTVQWPARETPMVAAESAPADPLADIRIMDLTAFWAGPAGSLVLGSLGADVVKVEGLKRPDGMRFAGGKPPTVDHWWETGSVFLAVNQNKRGVTLELGTSEGDRLARQLLASCDVVMENFSPRVMTNLGLDWDVVSSVNPHALMVRMPAFGLDGPWRDRVGFAQTMEQVSGMAWLTGEADGAPVIPRGACDPIAGLHAAFATIVGLEHRRRTRSGRAHRSDDGRGGPQRRRPAGDRAFRLRAGHDAGRQPGPRRRAAGGVPLRRRGSLGGDRGGDRCPLGGVGPRHRSG